MSRATGKVFPVEFMVDGVVQALAVPTAISVFGAEIYTASGLAGIGLIQVPRYRIAKELEAGQLREILPDNPPPAMPVSVLHPQNRRLSPRVRVFVEWLKEVFGALVPAVLRQVLPVRRAIPASISPQ